jgi:hypothetical protein
MRMDKVKLYGILFTVIIFFTSLAGCRTMTGIVIGTSYPAYEDEGPPPWAPAHGHRAKHQYRYYPSERVYFDPQQRVYFYLSGGNWQMSVSLPSTIRITVNDFVSLDMDSDRPYEHHNEVIKRYPPGQLKKKDDNRNNYKDDDSKKSRDNDKDKSQNNDKKNYSENDSKKSGDIDKAKTKAKAKAKLKSNDKNKDEDEDKDKDKDKDNKDGGRD